MSGGVGSIIGLARDRLIDTAAAQLRGVRRARRGPEVTCICGHVWRLEAETPLTYCLAYDPRHKKPCLRLLSVVRRVAPRDGFCGLCGSGMEAVTRRGVPVGVERCSFCGLEVAS